MRIYQIIFLALACLVPLVQLSKLNFIKYENVMRHMLHYRQQVLQCAIHEGYCTFLEGSKNWTDCSATITDGCVETFNASSPNHLPTPPPHTHTHTHTHTRTHTCTPGMPLVQSFLGIRLAVSIESNACK